MADEAGVDKAKMMQYLVPAGGVAAIVVLVALVISFSGAEDRKMSDGSDGSASDPGLKELTPGVKYRDIKQGTGEACPPGAKVTIHYTGWLTNGDVFDTSKKSATAPPTTFELGGQIKGWQEGIPGMKPGGIRKLVISPEKGYGDRGGGGKIPGGSTLIFEVELVEVLPAGSGALTSGSGQPMPFDKSNGGTDDKDLKDLGDGLKYRDLKEGEGEPVKPGATVTIHYTGWLVNGKVFDSNRNQRFPLNNLIKGWQIGIPGMKPGGVRKLVIPASLGYGAAGSQDGGIPGGATLIFEVELVK